MAGSDCSLQILTNSLQPGAQSLHLLYLQSDSIGIMWKDPFIQRLLLALACYLMLLAVWAHPL